jgi:hypothetical protein
VSAALLNIVIGLITSILGGGSVWLYERAKKARFLRRRAAFFGIEPGGTCLIVLNNKYNMPGSTHHQDVYAMIEVIALASETGAKVDIESCDDFRGSNGDRTEFCIGGPGSNPRTSGHMASHLPGVSLRPFDPGARDSMSFVAGDQAFPLDPGNQEYALVAKFTPREASRPVMVICGQTAITNRAAVGFLKREYGNLSKVLASIDRFCIMVRVPATGTYGHEAAELASDISEVALVTGT